MPHLWHLGHFRRTLGRVDRYRYQTNLGPSTGHLVTHGLILDAVAQTQGVTNMSNRTTGTESLDAVATMQTLAELERSRAELALAIEDTDDPTERVDVETRLEEVERAIARLGRDAERRQAAREERTRQEALSKTTERNALLASLVQLRDDLRGRYVEALARLDATPPVDARPLIAEAYERGRQTYALSHDLAEATGDRSRFALLYDVADQLTLRGGRTAETFLASLRGRRISVPTPWREDVARLRMLMPRAERIGNGG